MKTVSVKQVAALGVTPRAVIYKLEKGDFKGTRTPNQYGVQEWRIYPTKEIAEKLRPSSNKAQELDFDSEVIDAVEAESVNIEESKTGQAESNWLDVERERLRIFAEEMTRPLVETIRQQEQVIADQKRQLKLLPDLEKQAEEEHKPAEIKALEVEALKKQVTALELEKNAADEQRLLAEQEKAKARELEAQVEALLSEQAKVESTTAKLVEVEQALADLKARDEALRQELQQAKQPFWKKLFGK